MEDNLVYVKKCSKCKKIIGCWRGGMSNSCATDIPACNFFSCPLSRQDLHRESGECPECLDKKITASRKQGEKQARQHAR